MEKEYYSGIHYTIIFSRYGVPCMLRGRYDSKYSAKRNISKWTNNELHRPYAILKVTEEIIEKIG